MDYGAAGIEPEPRAGYRTTRERDAALERFSAATWQRHEHAKSAPHFAVWPTVDDFKDLWPALALELAIADWKHRSAYVAHDSTIELELLDPRPRPRASWPDLYWRELIASDVFAVLLQPEATPGDNLELVFEICQLTSEERAVLRAMLADQDLRDVAHDAGERLNTLLIRLRNALYRIDHVAQNRAPRRRRVQRSVSKGVDHSRDRASGTALQRAHGQGVSHDRLRRAG